MGFEKGKTPEGAKPFSSEYQPERNGRKKGVPNRSTVLKKWLAVSLEVTDPTTGIQETGTVEDEVMLALITKARLGDVPAIKEILDTMYGKLTDKLELTGADLDAAVERELARLAGGGEVSVSTEAQE